MSDYLLNTFFNILTSERNIFDTVYSNTSTVTHCTAFKNKFLLHKSAVIGNSRA